MKRLLWRRGSGEEENEAISVTYMMSTSTLKKIPGKTKSNNKWVFASVFFCKNIKNHFLPCKMRSLKGDFLQPLEDKDQSNNSSTLDQVIAVQHLGKDERDSCVDLDLLSQLTMNFLNNRCTILMQPHKIFSYTIRFSLAHYPLNARINVLQSRSALDDYLLMTK